MRVVDCRVHMRSAVQAPAALLRRMDDNGIERMIVISIPERNSLQQTRENLLIATKLFDTAPDRLSG